LSRWSRSDDIRLSAQAISALVNLDIDGNEKAKYPQSVYLLHPLHRVHATTKMDVVFLHGLLGGVFVTWRQRDIDTSALGVVGLLVFVYDHMISQILFFCVVIFIVVIENRII